MAAPCTPIEMAGGDSKFYFGKTQREDVQTVRNILLNEFPKRHDAATLVLNAWTDVVDTGALTAEDALAGLGPAL